jgi:hypothetical protein
MGPARAEQVTLTGEQFLAELPQQLAEELTAKLEGESFRVTAKWTGGSSVCALLEIGASRRRAILKRGKDGSPIAFEAEALAAAEGQPEAVRLPHLQGVLAGGAALLIEYLGGRNIRRAMRKGDSPRVVAAGLAASLRAYHQRTGTAFGDFHPGNAAVRRSAVTLLDPAPADWHGREPGESPVATDLGLWWFATAAYLPWDILKSPAGGWRLVQLGSELGSLLVADQAELEEAHRVAKRHLGWLWHAWPRDKVTFGPAWATVEFMARSAARRI